MIDVYIFINLRYPDVCIHDFRYVNRIWHYKPDIFYQSLLRLSCCHLFNWFNRCPCTLEFLPTACFGICCRTRWLRVSATGTRTRASSPSLWDQDCGPEDLRKEMVFDKKKGKDANGVCRGWSVLLKIVDSDGIFFFRWFAVNLWSTEMKPVCYQVPVEGPARMPNLLQALDSAKTSNWGPTHPTPCSPWFVLGRRETQTHLLSTFTKPLELLAHAGGNLGPKPGNRKGYLEIEEDRKSDPAEFNVFQDAHIPVTRFLNCVWKLY